MERTRADILAQLRKELLPLQGYKALAQDTGVDNGLGTINQAFPGNHFPVGAVHEFITDATEDLAATSGFVCGILASLMLHNGAAIWITRRGAVFPPALASFGIDPHRIIFIYLQKQQEIQWVLEEALKCRGLAGVIAELPEFSFTVSRRLQLAVEQSMVTGFIIRKPLRNLTTNACIARWKITSLPSVLPGNMPGVGYPRWQVELQKVRNGRPGKWQIEYAAGRFRQVDAVPAILLQPRKKTG